MQPDQTLLCVVVARSVVDIVVFIGYIGGTDVVCFV